MNIAQETTNRPRDMIMIDYQRLRRSALARAHRTVAMLIAKERIVLLKSYPIFFTQSVLALCRLNLLLVMTSHKHTNPLGVFRSVHSYLFHALSGQGPPFAFSVLAGIAGRANSRQPLRFLNELFNGPHYVTLGALFLTVNDWMFRLSRDAPPMEGKARTTTKASASTNSILRRIAATFAQRWYDSFGQGGNLRSGFRFDQGSLAAQTACGPLSL